MWGFQTQGSQSLGHPGDDNIPTEITQSQDSQELALLVARAPEYGVRRRAKKPQSRIYQAIKHRKDVQT